MAEQNQTPRDTKTAQLTPPANKKRKSAYDEPFENEHTKSFSQGAEKNLNVESTVNASEDPTAEQTQAGTAKRTSDESASQPTASDNPSSENGAKKSPRSSGGTKKKSAEKQTETQKSFAREEAHASTASSPRTKNDFGAKKDKTEKINMDVPRSTRPAHKVIPFVLFGLAVFVGISLLLNLFCNPHNSLSDPSAHWMGIVGYYICYALFGLFGPAAFVLPLLLLNLGLYWKRYIDHKLAISKIVASLLFLIMLGTVIHVFCLMGLEESTRSFTAAELFSHGAKMTGGGVIGGTLGYLLYSLCSFTGALIIGFLLLAASLFYFLGMTPQHVWEYIRNRRKMHAKRNPSFSEQSAEEASNRVKMEEKIRRTTTRQTSLENLSDTNFDSEAPYGAVRVVTPAPEKRSAEDKMAPMPTPRLDPNDGESVFVPETVNKKMSEMEEADALAARMQAAPPQPEKPIDPASNRDAAVEPIFPKTVERQLRKIPKEDRNFDLKTVFIDLDEKEERPRRKLAPVPPEVPLPATRTATGAPARPAASQSPVTQKPAGTPGAPMRTSAPQRPVAAQQPNSVANTIRTPGTPATPPTGAIKAPSKPLPKAPPPPDGAGKQPVFRRANTMHQDYGLSNEEFEKLEAQQVVLPKAGAVKKPAPAVTDGKNAPQKNTEKVAAKPAAPVKKSSGKRYVFPPISYLHPGEPMTEENKAEINASMQALSDTLKSFRVGVLGIDYACGPTVTRYEVTPAAGVRVRTITNLADDIALALRSTGGVRIEAPIPGTNAVGIEVPNKNRSTIYLRELIESKAFTESKNKLTACLGAGIAGEPLIFDIAKMPHLLIAGTTGSGKSVCINCIVMSLLYKATPDEVKLVMIDPKKVEFSIYKNIPHLMAPVVTTPKDAAGALQASVEEMERRFELFENVGVRDLKGYNAATADDPDMPTLPHSVIIIDELADLMMTARDEVETAICRIAQKARAAGMHLIIGTQRPSADVVTGLIKSNVPSRIAFAVKSQVDSRVILDHIGAEALTGRGDMLFVPIGSMRDTRVQGAFVDDKEVEKICEFIRATNGTAEYDEKFIAKLKELAAQCGNKGKSGGGDYVPSADGDDKGADPKYADAVRIAIEEKRISTSLLQRKLELGYSRAAKLIDRMQSEGLVSPPNGSKPRTILITAEEYMARFVDNPDGGEES
ncbi:MAG: DNA translocase FtsK 4TM domain-containing protein [Clostridia bacterium]|nr:DNA translocase FtsK 4TM domain-containing protein [Clostridia bacterium]